MGTQPRDGLHPTDVNGDHNDFQYGLHIAARLAETRLLQDPMLLRKKFVLSEMNAKRKKNLLLDKSTAFYFQKRQPIYLGLQMFNASLTMNHYGFLLSREVCSIVESAHLYNAVHVLCGTDATWPLME